MAGSLSEDGENAASVLLQPSLTDDREGDRTESAPEPKKQPLYSTKLSMQLDIWKYDILLYLLSVAATIALAIILFLQDGKPQRDWAGGPITLNTVVSILSATIRASVMVPIAAAITQEKWLWFGTSRLNDSHEGRSFSDYEVYDRASRGPLGSIQLLWILGVRNFASLGAVLAISSIAVGPFSQQILGTRFQLSKAAGLYQNTTNPLTKRYDALFHEHPRWPSQTEEARKTELATELTTLGMTAAIMSGLLSSDVQDLPSVCPTGNCTWPVQLSLAVCGHCTSFSPSLFYKCNVTDGDRPGGCYVTLTPEQEIFEAITGDEYFFSRPVASARASFYLKSNFLAEPAVYNDTVHPFLAIFQNIRVPRRVNQTSGLSPASGDECALWFCVKAYKTSVTEGVQTQDAVASSNNYMNVALDPDGYLERPENWIIRPEFRSYDFNPREDTYMSILDASIITISKDINDQLQGSLNTTYDGDNINHLTSSSSVMTALNTLNASTVTRNLAKSMTNHIRTQSPRGALNITVGLDGRLNGSSIVLSNTSNSSVSRQSLGTAYTYEPFFHVRWGWVALPVLLVLLAPICLTATISASWESDTPALGSGLLALVGVRVEQDVRSRFDGVDRYDVAKDRAEGVMVKLERDEEGEGWEIRGLEKQHVA